jgi:hypothetical protein
MRGLVGDSNHTMPAGPLGRPAPVNAARKAPVCPIGTRRTSRPEAASSSSSAEVVL